VFLDPPPPPSILEKEDFRFKLLDDLDNDGDLRLAATAAPAASPLEAVSV